MHSSRSSQRLATRHPTPPTGCTVADTARRRWSTTPRARRVTRSACTGTGPPSMSSASALPRRGRHLRREHPWRFPSSPASSSRQRGPLRDSGAVCGSTSTSRAATRTASHRPCHQCATRGGTPVMKAGSRNRAIDSWVPPFSLGEFRLR